MTERRRMPRWPLMFVCLPAATAVWSGWVGVGAMTGFGVVHPLPGIFPRAEINTVLTLPVGVEFYGAYALGAWLGDWDMPAKARKFAKWSAMAALGLGALGQIAYHLLAPVAGPRAPWIVTVLVAIMPVVVVGFAATLMHLMYSDTAPSAQDTGTAHASPRTAPAVPASTPIPGTAGAPKPPVPVSTKPAVAGTPKPAPAASTAKPRLRDTADLLDGARKINDEWRATHGRDISADALVPRLNVSKTTACKLLRQVKGADGPEVQEAAR